MALFGRDKKIDHLRQLPILQGATRRELLAVAQIADVVEAPAGKVLARAGEPGEEFFLIRRSVGVQGVPSREGESRAPQRGHSTR